MGGVAAGAMGPGKHRGTVARLNPAKGFGFVRDDQTGSEYFLHATGVVGRRFDQLAEGHAIEFELDDSHDAMSRGGPRAVSVVKL